MRISALLLLASTVSLAACGSGAHKTTIQTSSGIATVTQQGQTATYQSKEGTVTVKQGAVDASQLGAPIYPGAKTEGSLSMNASTANQGSGTMASFTTADSFDNVYTWYKQHLPAGSEKMKMESGGQSVAEFVTGDEKSGQTAVMISEKDGKTAIAITHGTKTGSY